MFPIAYDGVAFIMPISRSKFTDYLNNNNTFEKMFSQDVMKELTKIKSHIAELEAAAT